MTTTKYLTQPAKMRARALLDMLYTPDELAQELKLPKRIVYDVLIPHGLPISRDAKKRIWIHGTSAAAWFASSHAARKKRIPLKDDETYCVKCRMPVPIIAPRIEQKRKQKYIVSDCPKCQTRCNRAVRND